MLTEDSSKRTRGPWWTARWVFRSALALVVLLHLVLILQVERNAPLFGGQPLSWIDLDTHAEQTWRVTDAMAQWGKPWCYDVKLLAGYPTGTVFDADNKGWELFTYLLWHYAGLNRATAFNLFVLVAHLLVAPVVYSSARLFRLGRWQALAATTMGLGVWFFDGLARWSWFSGAVSYAIVSYLFLWPVAMFYAFVRTGRWHWLVLASIVLAVGHLIHPAMFIVSVVPMVGLYARSARHMSRGRHVAVFAMAAFVVLVNAWWLVTAFRFAHYVTDHEPFFIATPWDLVLDMGELIDDLTRTGLIGNRTGFRMLAWLLGLAGLVWMGKSRWVRAPERHGSRKSAASKSEREGRDDRWLPLVLGVGFLLTLAYVLGNFWVLRQVQPYRNVVPAAMLATIPAGWWLGKLVEQGAFRGMSTMGRVAVAIVAFVAASHLARDVLYFLPENVPEVPALPTGETIDMTAFGYPKHHDFRHEPPESHFRQVVSWVREHDHEPGRFLVEWWVMGEHLLAHTDAEVLGGFRQRNLQHHDANLFYRYPDGHVPDDVLEAYFRRYAVRWVIMSQQMPFFEHKTKLLHLVATLDRHRIYETTVPISYIRSGPGKVSAQMNRIEVRGSDPHRDVVLRFHWLETLRCEPGCQLRREPILNDSVGFLRIPAPHPVDFAVVNRY